MARKTYGTPDANDGTARFERVINRSRDRYAEIFKQAVERVAPRALGSKPVPLSEQKLEWELLRNDPAALQQFFESQSVGLESALSYAEKMEKSRGAD